MTDKIKSAKEYCPETDESLREGHRVLATPDLKNLNDGEPEMTNVFGLNKSQARSTEDESVINDSRTNTHNKASFPKDGK